MARDRFQQPPGDLFWGGIKEANPMQIFDSGELLQQLGQAVLQAKILAIAGRVLSDQSNFPDPAPRQPLGLGYHRLEAPRAKLSSQLRNNAEGARMIAALRDFDISHVPWRGQDSRCGIVVKIVGKIADCAVPRFPRKASLWGPSIAFGSRLQHYKR